MLRFLIPALIAGLVTTTGCGSDEDGLTGTFNLFVSDFETDTCDDDPTNTFSSQVTITEQGGVFTLSFGDAGDLAGERDDEGLIQAEGFVDIPVEVNGEANLVEAFMEIQLGVRRTRLEASGRLTFDGTHPNKPLETCQQIFVATGQRASRVPAFLTGPQEGA